MMSTIWIIESTPWLTNICIVALLEFIYILCQTWIILEQNKVQLRSDLYKHLHWSVPFSRTQYHTAEWPTVLWKWMTYYICVSQTHWVSGCTRTVFAYLGRKSQPCCMSEPIANHKQLCNENWFSKWSGFGLQGCGFCHSYGVNLETSQLQH